MSRPGGPYRDERYPPQQPQYPQGGYQQGYPQRGYPDQGYGPGPDHGQRPAPGHGDQGYGQGYDRGYDPGYGDADDRGYGQRRQAPQRPAEPERSWEPEREGGGGFRLPGLGLIFSLLGLIVQILCLTVLPWFSAPGNTAALPEIWKALKDVQAGGFAGTYVVLFSYPLAVLGILLSLVSVLQAVAMKVIWAALAFIGVAALVLKFGWGPISGGGMHFTRQEITLGIVAAVVLVVVIFMLRMAMSTFRIVGGIVLLVCAGVHVAALRDMTGDVTNLEIGAYGPALGYVLAALAAFIGPRRIA